MEGGKPWSLLCGDNFEKDVKNPSLTNMFRQDAASATKNLRRCNEHILWCGGASQ